MDRRLCLFGALLWLLPSAGAQHAKISPELNASAAETETNVIVQYRVTPNARHAERVRSRGGKHNRRWNFVNSDHYSISRRDLRELADDPEVVAIHPDRVVTGSLDLTAAATGAGAAWASGFTGAGVGVAVY